MGSFSSRLRSTRELAGDLSARELARLAGLSEAIVGFVERGSTESPHLLNAIDLARVLGVDVTWLGTGEGDEPTAETVRTAVAAARAELAARKGAA